MCNIAGYDSKLAVFKDGYQSQQHYIDDHLKWQSGTS